MNSVRCVRTQSQLAAIVHSVKKRHAETKRTDCIQINLTTATKQPAKPKQGRQMNDFTYYTYYTYYQCDSTEGFSTEVNESDGSTHTVRYTASNQNDPAHGYSCTCLFSKAIKPALCKHIEQARKEGKHCTWMQFLDGGQPTVEPDGTRVCPECGSDVTKRQWAC